MKNSYKGFFYVLHSYLPTNNKMIKNTRSSKYNNEKWQTKVQRKEAFVRFKIYENLYKQRIYTIVFMYNKVNCNNLKKIELDSLVQSTR